MAKGEHIVISLSRRHADNIFSGRKQVELRRRPMNVAPGTTVWVYVKLPVGSIVGRARVGAIHASSPTTLWRRFGAVSGLSRKEFFDYFEGVAAGVALVLENAQRLRSALSLKALRKLANGFQPPQFFLRLREEHPFFATILSSR